MPRHGLRLSEQERRDLAAEYQGARFEDDLEGKEHLMEFHFLPAYSPKLNAVEYVWRKTKRAITHNKFFPRLQDLRQALARRFNRFQGNPASLRSAVPHFA